MNHDDTTDTTEEERDGGASNSSLLIFIPSVLLTWCPLCRGGKRRHQCLSSRLLPFSGPSCAEPSYAEQSLDRSWLRIELRRPELGVREVTGFCLEAAGRNQHRERIEPALEIVRKLQDRQTGSKTFGNFRWRWGDVVVHDLNGVEFVVEQAVLIELRYRDRLSLSARATLRDLLTDAVIGVQPIVCRCRIRTSF